MACKLTQNITSDNCDYQLAGVKSVYLLNADAETEYTFGTNEQQNVITAIKLGANNALYKIDFIENTASFTDDLAVNGNGGKYRTHTVNFTIGNLDYKILNENKALSLGKFTAVLVDKSGRICVLGRVNGLSATSNNYASGAADADANGWTVVLAGTENETAKIVESFEVIKDLISKDPVIIP